VSTKIPDNFCPVPWLEIHSGTGGKVSPCCTIGNGFYEKLNNFHGNENWDLYNSPLFTQLRDSFLKGEQHKACVRCWESEVRGLSSRRKRALKKYQDKTQAIIEKSSTYCNSPNYIDFRLSSKCNLRCKMCNPTSSTSIRANIRDLKSKGINNSYTNRAWDDVDDSEFIVKYILENDDINNIQIAGGEPFLEKKVKELLRELINQNRNRKCSVGIMTNLSIIDLELVEMLVQFKNIEFHCSIDGAGKEFEYQREPLKWEKCKKNLEELIRLIKPHDHAAIAFTPCATHLNIRSLPSMLRYLYTLDIERLSIILTPVLQPEYLHYTFVPLKYRIAIADELDDILSTNTLRMNETSNETWKKFSLSLRTESDIDINRIKGKLKDAIVCWDTQNNTKWTHLYPWASILS
jgi:MoaA/NifB/PqqE/SkfB family radical SAM enzyme